MRTIVVYELLSFDGVAEDPDGFITDWDEVMEAGMVEVIASQDAVVLGRRTYEEWARYWPGIEEEHPFARFINGVAKHVATSTPLDLGWANATAIEGDLVDVVRRLKSEPGGDIGVHASISVAQALLTAGLVDRLRLVVAPNVAGHGRRLLDGVPPFRLELVGCTTTPTGHLLLDHRVLP